MGNFYCIQENECIEKIWPKELEFNLSTSQFQNFENPFYPNGYKNHQKEEKLLEIEEKERLRREEEERLKKEEEERIRREKERLRKEEEERLRKEDEERILELKRIEEEKKEKMKLNELKEAILKKEAENRKGMNIINNSNENISIEDSIKIENDKVNEVLENMCIMGNITKKEIEEEKKNNPEKFIDTSEALQKETEDSEMFVLGLLSQKLESMGIETAIEKGDNDASDVNIANDEQDAATTCLQYITNGLAEKKKYDLHFEFGEERNAELINNKEEFENFKKELKRKLSKDYHIPEDKIVVTFPQKGSFHVQVIFQSDEFNDLNVDEFKEKFQNDDEFKELQYLKEIHTDIIMGGCKLSKNQLDSRGNIIQGYGENEYRGGRPYNPPLGWIGIGLRVLDKYDNNNDWIGHSHSPGEWCVAYHGVGRGKTSEEVKNITGIIPKTTFKEGENQVHSTCENINKPGSKIGDGVYVTPNIKTACAYSGYSEINGSLYSTALMVRVKPDAIRQCNCDWANDYWVVNGTTDEIRPYRILYKKINPGDAK